jgi:integrase
MARRKVLRIRKDLPATWEEALQQYLWFKQAEGLRDITIRGHKDVISLLFKRHPGAFDAEKARMAVYSFMGEKIKPATYNIRRNYLKQFFAWCIREGIFYENPFDDIKKRKDEGRIVNLDEETLKQLISLPDLKTYAGLRDYGLILLTLDTGIRPKEAFSLLPSDVNFRALEIYIRSDVSKTKVSRTLSILPVTAQTIKDVLQAKHSAWKDPLPIFCTTEGNPMTRDTWSHRMIRYSDKLGVKILPMICATPSPSNISGTAATP